MWASPQNRAIAGRNLSPILDISALKSLRAPADTQGFGAGIAVPHGKSACVKQPFILFARKADGVDWKASDDEAVNCWICIGVPQAGEDEQVKMIGTLCRRLIHADFVSQLKQGDMSQILTLLNHTLTQ